MTTVTIDSRRPCQPSITPSTSRYALRIQAKAYSLAAASVEQDGMCPRKARQLADSIIHPS